MVTRGAIGLGDKGHWDPSTEWFFFAVYVVNNRIQLSRRYTFNIADKQFASDRFYEIGFDEIPLRSAESISSA